MPPRTAIDSDPLAPDSAKATQRGVEHLAEPDRGKALLTFYGTVISKEREKRSQRGITRTPDEEQRAFRRALLPHKLERLEREREQAGEEAKRLSEKLEAADRQAERLNQVVENQRQAIDNQQQELEKLQAPDTERACALTQIVHRIKSTARNKAHRLTQAEITRDVE